MRSVLAGVAILLATARMGHAGRYGYHARGYEEPYLEVAMDVGRASILEATVIGYPMPTPDRLTVHESGETRLAIPPETVTSYVDGPDSVTLAIVYPAEDAWLGEAIERSGLTSAIPSRSQVTVISYGNEVETRLPWSSIGALRREMFDVRKHDAPKVGAAMLSGVEAGVAALDGMSGRRVLLLITDGCDTSSDDAKGELAALEERTPYFLETVAIVHENHVFCGNDLLDGFVETRLVASTERFGAALAEVIDARFRQRWYATFKVSLLPVWDGTFHDIVLDVGEAHSASVSVYFEGQPPARPSRSSSLRQIGVGALLVGLLALALRSRFRARRAR